MASRTPMAVNTRKARMIDAKEGNLNRTIGVASEHIPAPISSRSTKEQRDARMNWDTRRTVAVEVGIAVMKRYGITPSERREPTEEERREAWERIRAYRLSIIKERREVCLQ